MATPSPVIRNLFAVALLTLLALVVLLVACETDDAGEKWERARCTQAVDCGPEGRAGWVCSPEGICYTQAEYCLEDAECRGACIENVCENGKIVDGDGTEDGDSDETEPDCPDTYECCKDADCPMGSHCNLDVHICVLNNTCTFQCCQDADCEVHPDFGPGHICRFNACVPHDAPCTTECCEHSDCAPGYVCELGTCVEHRVSCNAGDEVCCASQPGVAGCIELGDLAREAVLTCNAAGNGYRLSMCPDFHDCIFVGNGKTDCFPNGRCETDADCPCPQVCQQGTNGLRCLPPALNPGDTCFGIACEGQTTPASLGQCPEGSQCCLDDTANPTTGSCQASCAR